MTSNNDLSVELSAALDELDQLASDFDSRMMEAEAHDGGKPAEKFALINFRFAYLQVRAISLLVRSDRAYWPQVAQLLRGLVEVWSIAAWLLEPDDPKERLKRAIGYEQKGLSEHRQKLEYQESIGVAPSAGHTEALVKQETILEAQITAAGVTGLPRAKKRMADLDQPERYLIFRWESDSVHMSSIAARHFLRSMPEADVVDGDPGPETMVTRVTAAWDLANDIFTLCLEMCGISDHAWTASTTASKQHLTELMPSLDTWIEDDAGAFDPPNPDAAEADPLLG